MNVSTAESFLWTLARTNGEEQGAAGRGRHYSHPPSDGVRGRSERPGPRRDLARWALPQRDVDNDIANWEERGGARTDQRRSDQAQSRETDEVPNDEEGLAVGLSSGWGPLGSAYRGFPFHCSRRAATERTTSAGGSRRLLEMT